jgi:hypothetical protein
MNCARARTARAYQRRGSEEGMRSGPFEAEIVLN